MAKAQRDIPLKLKLLYQAEKTGHAGQNLSVFCGRPVNLIPREGAGVCRRAVDVLCGAGACGGPP